MRSAAVSKKEEVTRLKDAQLKLLELDIRFIRPDVAVVHQLHVLSGKRDRTEPRCRLSGSYPRASWSRRRANG